MSFLKDWILKPEYFPVWLQALVAFIALGLGVWSVRAAGAAQKRRDRLELRGLAVAIYPELLMLPSVIQRVRVGLSLLEARNGDQSFSASMELTAPIQLPLMLERNIDKLFLLGDVAGPSCLSLVRFIYQYNETVQRKASEAMMMDASLRIEALGQIGQHLTLLEQIVAKCVHEVAPIHDSIKE